MPSSFVFNISPVDVYTCVKSVLFLRAKQNGYIQSPHRRQSRCAHGPTVRCAYLQLHPPVYVARVAKVNLTNHAKISVHHRPQSVRSLPLWFISPLSPDVITRPFLEDLLPARHRTHLTWIRPRISWILLWPSPRPSKRYKQAAQPRSPPGASEPSDAALRPSPQHRLAQAMIFAAFARPIAVISSCCASAAATPLASDCISSE